MNIAISLPQGSGYGWAICANNLRSNLPGVVTERYDRTDDIPVVFREPMIHAIQGVNMLPLSLTEWSLKKNVGLCFIEESELVKKYIPNARRYFDHVCAGSTWNAEILREAGLENVSVAIQGVDSEFFCPGTKPLPEDRFTIFSGGKHEWRKGTDIALKVIGIMMQRHKDVYAVGAWHNPWQHSIDTLATHPTVIPWRGNIFRMIEDAKIPRERLSGPLDSPTSQRACLDLYRHCDIGLFTNRVEGGTNMVLCEFMACEKPVVALAEHGHADVVRIDSRFTVFKCEHAMNKAGQYWEPDLDECVDMLEYAYQRRDVAREEGRFNRHRMLDFTWKKTAEALLEACK